tara:strand:+ start:295 stop:552 length:258 start_codon:yes stop_codon:yes gene_type:complete
VTIIVSNADENNKKFELGDLVIFSGVSQRSIKNQIGIVIGDSVSGVTDEFLREEEWYVVQFGTMKLIVNDTMIEKLETKNHNDGI